MKKIISLLLVLALTFSFTACSGSSNETTTVATTTDATVAATSSEVESSSSEAEDSYYPITFKTFNYEGKEVEITVEKQPEKVVCAYQNSIEVMLRLGLSDKIVAAFGLDEPVAEDLKSDFDKINYLDKTPSKEEVIAMEPDFILGWCSLFGEKRLGDLGYWNENGVGTYVALNSGCRRRSEGYKYGIEEELQDILTVGKIFNVQDKAEAIVQNIRDEIAKIENHVKDIDKVGIAILEDEGDSFRVYGATTLGGDIALKAGAELTIGSEDSQNVSAEELIAADPEAIFMVYFFGYLEPEDAVKAITENPKFASLQAVQNDKVFALGLTNVYCSGVRSMDGVLTFSKNLYPELYK